MTQQLTFKSSSYEEIRLLIEKAEITHEQKEVSLFDLLKLALNKKALACQISDLTLATCLDDRVIALIEPCAESVVLTKSRILGLVAGVVPMVIAASRIVPVSILYQDGKATYYFNVDTDRKPTKEEHT